MTTTQSPKLPTPRQARKAAGFSPVELAAKAGLSLSWIYRCEAVAKYPEQAAKRTAYLTALGLTEVKP